MLPVAICETLIRAFNFYHEGQLQAGMSYGPKLYRLVHTYKISSRLQAYTLGCNLSKQCIRVVITVSDRRYKVWTEIRSQSAPSALCDIWTGLAPQIPSLVPLHEALPTELGLAAIAKLSQ